MYIHEGQNGNFISFNIWVESGWVAILEMHAEYKQVLTS